MLPQDPPVEAIRQLLIYLGENPDRSGMAETPLRFIKAMHEMTAGYREDPTEHLRKEFKLGDDEPILNDQIILSGAIPFVSMCEHHMLPFEGVVHIGYLPNQDKENSSVVGLSKFARMVDGWAKRFQIQERLTQQIASSITKTINPAGVGVLVKARHTCQCYRGVKKGGYMLTSSMQGVFRDEPETRAEFLELIRIGAII